MKKILSILLVCAMLLSFGITATATETEQTNDTLIEQIERINADSLEGGKEDYEGQYTGVLYPQTNTSQYAGTLKIAHDGDYLYLVSYATNNYSNRKNFEMHIYIEFEDAKYQIIALPNYAQYVLETDQKATSQFYTLGYTGRYASDSNYGYRFGVYANETAYPESNDTKTEDATTYGILSGLNSGMTNNSNDDDFGGYEIMIPMPETIRSKLGNGENIDVSIGFTYMLNGNNNSYITTGTAPTETPLDWRAWANSGSSNALVDVTLKGTAQDDNAQVPYNTTNSTLVGVQTNLATDAAEGTTYSARFVAALNTFDLANAKVYFRFVGNKATVNEQCNTVFNSITADGNNVPAWYLGADYLYCLKVNDLKLGTEYTFEIGAYCEGQDAVTMYTVTVDENGAITASPLAS